MDEQFAQMTARGLNTVAERAERSLLRRAFHAWLHAHVVEKQRYVAVGAMGCLYHCQGLIVVSSGAVRLLV